MNGFVGRVESEPNVTKLVPAFSPIGHSLPESLLEQQATSFEAVNRICKVDTGW